MSDISISMATVRLDIVQKSESMSYINKHLEKEKSNH